MSAATTHIDEARPASVDHRVVGVGAAVVGLASLAVANFVTPGENGGAAEFAVLGGAMLAVAGIVFGLVVPRAVQAGTLVRTALILTALSLFGVVMFWTGIGQITAPAAILLGYLALQQGDARRGGALAAIALSGLFYAGVLVASVVG
jgi:hypothetical protein